MFFTIIRSNFYFPCVVLYFLMNKPNDLTVNLSCMLYYYILFFVIPTFLSPSSVQIGQ